MIVDICVSSRGVKELCGLTCTKMRNVGFNFMRTYTTASQRNEIIKIQNRYFPTDDYTNVTPKVLCYLDRNIYLQKNHPLSLLRERIVDYFYSTFITNRGHPEFSIYDRLSPVVSVKQNFDNLLIPKDHVSRVKSDCYYINRETMLRGHMTAHQSDLIRSGLDNFLMIGDVYRRDEIDSTHYPVFHQVDGVRSQTKEQLFCKQPDLEIFEPDSFLNAERDLDPLKQHCHTLEAAKLMEHQQKKTLEGLVKHLFGEKIQHRWVDAYFPFTHPSWELEIYFNNNWLEILGCGIVRNEILCIAGSRNRIAYAFGLGLERLAMALYEIPDIRLFWSKDSGFLQQFDGNNSKPVKYKPVSAYPQCKNDMSFWLPLGQDSNEFSSNDFYDLVRDLGGDIVEQVNLIDSFTHPKTKKHSLCYRITYRHMERTLTQEEVNIVHKKIGEAAVDAFCVTMRW